MSEDEIKHCIIQALKDKDPTWLQVDGVVGGGCEDVDDDDYDAEDTVPV
jgi:hypothetical protein